MYIAKVTINHTKVPSNQTDFVVYLNLAHLPAAFWSLVANGGGDIRIYKSDGTTQLPREVVFCDTSNQTGELHFKFSGTLSSSVDTEIQIHADGSSAEPSVSSTYGRNNVWTDYKAVYHFQTTTADSTGNGYTLTASGSPTTGTGKLSGYALDLGSGNTSSRMKIGDNLGIAGNAALTISGWMKRYAEISSSEEIAWAHRSTTTVDRYIQPSYQYNGGSRQFTANVSNSFFSASFTAGTGWFYYWDTREASTPAYTMKINGAQVASGTGGSATAGGNYFAIGDDGGTFGRWNGLFDEVRVANAVFSTDRHITENNNQGDPATFYTASALSTAYSMNAVVAAFALTGIAAIFRKTLIMAAARGTFVLTGIANMLKKGYGFMAVSASFALTGFSAGLKKGYGLAAGVGSFVLTGVSVTFQAGKGFMASTGSFILSGIAAGLRSTAWSSETKPTSVWDPEDRGSTAWTPRDKS